MNLAMLPRLLPSLDAPPGRWVSTEGLPSWVHDARALSLGTLQLPWGEARVYLAPWGLGLLQWRDEARVWWSAIVYARDNTPRRAPGLAHRLAEPASWLQRRRRRAMKAKSTPSHGAIGP